MSFTIYQASVPVFLRALGNLRAVLQKGEAFAADKGIEPSVLLNSRLIADMYPLTKQVQIATDMAVRGTSRLAGTEPPSFPDTETDFAGLYASIAPWTWCVASMRHGSTAAKVARSTCRGAGAIRCASMASPTCCITCCRTCSSTAPPPTRSCARPAWRWARTISWARADTPRKLADRRQGRRFSFGA